MQKARILPVLMVLFSISVAARAGEKVVQLDDLLSQTPPPPPVKLDVNQTFDELDEWERGLYEREKEMEAQRLAAERAAAETARKAEELAERERQLEHQKVSIRKLSQLYSAMETDRAAATLARLPQERSAAILLAMAPDRAGPILGAMPIDLAQKIADEMVKFDP
ncbi:magnesium transporter MgtE N-terminal domain-containing protein [Parvularcula sp. LCG005]|uniref:magnesium transporter MgtE N-terminal domain-containing protein n=1 Tax=Parvularcula sp. LCG005 TaxID=3078805 RepID=UPI002943249F|nr:hypothetical protein [Parvularcula sp. LCG005]WOI52927.1 hypothetical protein RUI03_12295 [Parvularcula sp. LCG005]